MNADPIRQHFLEAQREPALDLARASDGILELLPLAPERYLARFRARGLVRTRAGEIREHDELVVGLRFPEDYLHAIRPPEIVTVLAPQGELMPFHPNMHPELPYLCPGHLPPGLPLVQLLWQVYEIWTWTHPNFASFLNDEAAEWGRHHPERYPVDRRPLARLAARKGGTP